MKEYIFKQYLDNILNYLDISVEELFEKTKKDEIVKPRQMLFYLCNVKSNMGQKEISGYLKKINQDVPQEIIHYGISTFKKLIEEDKEYIFIADKLSNIKKGILIKDDLETLQEHGEGRQLGIFNFTKDNNEKNHKDIKEDSVHSFCPSCGKQILIQGNFCSQCGNKLI
jgi:hypothetical protein